MPLTESRKCNGCNESCERVKLNEKGFCPDCARSKEIELAVSVWEGEGGSYCGTEANA